MINLFGNSAKNVEKSLEKYGDIIRNDVNLTIRVRYKGIMYDSYVESFEGKELIFRRPNDKFDIVRFNENTYIKVELISNNRLFETELLVIKKIVRGEIVYYTTEVATPIKERQRRKYERLPIVLNVDYTILPAESEIYEGSTQDISYGGMLLESAEAIKTKDIKVKFNIEGQKYESKCKILKRRTNYKNGSYIYNIRFLDMNSRHRSQIDRYVINNLARY